jgi:hypothetical protein
MQAKSRKWAVKETRTEVHVARASLSPCSDLPIVELFLDLNMQEIFAAACYDQTISCSFTIVI